LNSSTSFGRSWYERELPPLDWNAAGGTIRGADGAKLGAVGEGAKVLTRGAAFEDGVNAGGTEMGVRAGV
jgi:hypothetical protein